MQKVRTDPAKELAETSKGLSKQLLEFFTEERKKGLDLIEPLIRRSEKMISDQPGEVLAALSGEIAPMEFGYTGARGRIMESTEPGAARNFALALLEKERGAEIGKARSGLISGAYQTLAQIGSNLASYGLNELTGSLQSLDIARAGYGDIMQAQALARAGTLGFLGQLARIAGGIAGAKLGW